MRTTGSIVIALGCLCAQHPLRAHDVAEAAFLHGGLAPPDARGLASHAFLQAYDIDIARDAWTPVPGDANAWRSMDATLSGGDCPAFIFRNDFESGRLEQAGGAGFPILYVSSGGYQLAINRHTITVRDMTGANRVEHWGDPHENLNGKHIKDWGGAPGWDGMQRTIVLGDDTRITMTADGAQGVVVHTSIYDGRRNVQVANAGNLVEHESLDPEDTLAREQAQHDGETSLFTTDAVDGVARYTNIYNEDAAFQRIDLDVPLGSSGGCVNPNQVRDYFDDPRLGHT